MVTIPCPWCDHEVAMPDASLAATQLRCDECATVVDLAPEPAPARPVAERMPLAA